MTESGVITDSDTCKFAANAVMMEPRTMGEKLVHGMPVKERLTPMMAEPDGGVVMGGTYRVTLTGVLTMMLVAR